MKIDTMFRHAREAFKSLRRNTWMTFAAVSAVAVTLLIFGLFLVFAFNINYLAKELDQQVAIRASIYPGTSADDIEQLQKQIEQDPAVKSVTFIPKAQGLQQMKAQLGEDSKILEGLEGEENPLPDTLVIVPKDPQRIKELAKRIEANNLVEEEDHGDGVTDKLLDFSSLVRNVVLVFGLGLAVLAAFLISNTIKLTIFARRREIEIMRLVGASNWFIRWPFFIEGAFIGMLGAVFPVIIVLAFYKAALNVLTDGSQYSFIKMLPMMPLSLYVALLTTLLGVLIGIWGSVISIRRFLRV